MEFIMVREPYQITQIVLPAIAERTMCLVHKTAEPTIPFYRAWSVFVAEFGQTGVALTFAGTGYATVPSLGQLLR